MEVIRKVYGSIDSGSESDYFFSGNSKLSRISTTSNNQQSPSQVERPEEVWSHLQYGLQIRAFQRIFRNVLEVRFSTPGFPPFSLSFPEPIAPRTFILLPGAAYLFAFSKTRDICLWNLQESYTPGEDREINAAFDIMNAMMTLDDQEYCQNIKGIGRSHQAIFRDTLFSLEVTAAQIVSTKEAVIVTTVFKNAIVR